MRLYIKPLSTFCVCKLANARNANITDTNIAARIKNLTPNRVKNVNAVLKGEGRYSLNHVHERAAFTCRPS